MGVVQFDTTRNRFLAAGDEFQIKFWDMDNINILTYTDADGGLPVSISYHFAPCRLFNLIALVLETLKLVCTVLAGEPKIKVQQGRFIAGCYNQ